MLPIFFLIAVSIVIPPFWFITSGYIIYLIATKKQRRDKVIMHEVMQSIAQKRERVLLRYLYFDSAKSFAVDHGAILSKHDNDVLEDTLAVELDIDGQSYQITLQRQDNDETLLSVYFAEKAKKNKASTANELPLIFKDTA